MRRMELVCRGVLVLGSCTPIAPTGITLPLRATNITTPGICSFRTSVAVSADSCLGRVVEGAYVRPSSWL